MDLLVAAFAFVCGLFLVYVVDIVSKEPDQDWAVRVRYRPFRWVVSSNSWVLMWVGGPILTICALAGALQSPRDAITGIALYAMTVVRWRWPVHAKRVNSDPIAVAALNIGPRVNSDPIEVSALNIGLRVMVATLQAFENDPLASKISDVRFRGGILTVYLSAEDAELRTLILDFIRERDPNLRAYVVVDTPVAPDPAVV